MGFLDSSVCRKAASDSFSVHPGLCDGYPCPCGHPSGEGGHVHTAQKGTDRKRPIS